MRWPISTFNCRNLLLKEDNFYLFDWRFSENGLLGFYDNQQIHKRSFVEAMTETHHKKLINICLYV